MYILTIWKHNSNEVRIFGFKSYFHHVKRNHKVNNWSIVSMHIPCGVKSFSFVWGSVGDAEECCFSSPCIVELVGESHFKCVEYGSSVSYVVNLEKRNAQTFEETERIVDSIKSLLLRTLFEWSHIWGFTHCHSLFEFLNSVSLSFWLVCILFYAVSLLS